MENRKKLLETQANAFIQANGLSWNPVTSL